MGQAESAPTDGKSVETDEPHSSATSGHSVSSEQSPSPESAHGYRVMKVFRGSAAARCGLSAFEDFILGVRGTPVWGDDRALAETLSGFEGRDVELDVYNIIDRSLRPVVLRPVKWNGPGLLGAAVRFEAVAGAADFVWHVVDVIPNSPADEAGLVPSSDYIVGTPAQAFRADSDFGKLVAECVANGSAASVMVYSTATSRVRNVELRPNAEWGGNGVLGCELATGLLHQIRRDDGRR